ncbi:MAG: LPS-assembly protein LptD [Halioglobus sp.]|nr:LPS-assembly protein LptD [Halioglobus sp.]
MTPYRARTRFYPVRAAARLTAIVLALALPFSMAQTSAQDNNAGDCSANKKRDRPIGCDTQEKAAAIVPVLAFDWIPLASVPESLRDRECVICEGRYIDPLAKESKRKAPRENDIHARADTSEMREDEAILTGDVTAIQGYRQMRSDKAIFDREDETATLIGNITMREPGLLLQGDNAKIYSATGEALMYDAQFVFYESHLRGTADALARDENDIIHIHNGTFTYCPPGEQDWAVLSDVMDVDLEEGLATAHHATIEVEGVPVFYTPWLRLPLDDRRRTGLLWPDFGNDSDGGLDISVPLYLNLAPNYDALYAPRYIQERGLDHELQLRYLNPLVGEWLAAGAYLKNDSLYADDIPDTDSADRWLGILRQNGLFEERWRSQIDYSKASDVDYMRDLDTANIDAQRKTNLIQMASMDYLGDNWLTSLRAQQFQSLADDINKDYEEIPQLTSFYRSSGTPFQLQPILLAQYSNFGSNEDIVTGERLYGETGMSYPMLWGYGFLTPTLKYRQVTYELNDDRNENRFPDNSPSAGAPLFSMDGGLVFERETSFGEKGFLQTLEPRLYYLYSEKEDQFDQPNFDTTDLTFSYSSLYRDTRFSGHDRLDDANQISAGVTTRYIDNETGRDLLSASIGQIYYFGDREVLLASNSEPETDASSGVAGELNFTPNKNFGVRTSLVWDHRENNAESAFVIGSYKTDNNAIFNLGYAYRRYLVSEAQPQTDEVNASTYLPLDNNWSIFGAMSYSLEDNLSVEDLVGVEYDSCCWRVRLVHLRYYNNVNGNIIDFSDPDLERQKSIQFQILLKGMGGFGNRISNIMQEMIRGFRDREY